MSDPTQVPAGADPKPQPANNSRYVVAALLLAASVLLVALPFVGDDDWTGLRGSADLSAPTLRVFTGDGQGEIASGASVPAGTKLVFRYANGAPAKAAMLAVDGGKAEVIWQGEPVQPGEHEVTVEGEAVAWTVEKNVVFGLRLLEPDTPYDLPMTMASHCQPTDPCTLFEVSVR